MSDKNRTPPPSAVVFLFLFFLSGAGQRKGIDGDKYAVSADPESHLTAEMVASTVRRI
jgi:hypothetical protein